MIVAVVAELRWECWHSNRGCYDGQGGIVLVVLAPCMFGVGGLLGALWTWLRFRMPMSRIFSHKQIGGMALPIGFWLLMCFGLFLVLIYLDQY